MTQAAPKKKSGKRKITIIIGIVLGALALAVGFGVASFANDNGPPALTLPDSDMQALVTVDGEWRLSSGTVGYRAREKAFGIGHDVVGRTDEVAGTAIATNGTITEANVEVSLTAFQVDGKTHAASSHSVGASQQPTATFVTTGAISVDGTKGPVDVMGTLTFNGQSHPVTWRVTPKTTGANQLDLLGMTTIDVTEWGVTPPSEAGIFSIDKQVTLEFLTTWQR